MCNFPHSSLLPIYIIDIIKHQASSIKHRASIEHQTSGITGNSEHYHIMTNKGNWKKKTKENPS
jgi:hypothetical protein